MQQVLASRPQVQECYLITGEFDFVMVAKLRDANEYTDYSYNVLETYRDIPNQDLFFDPGHPHGEKVLRMAAQ